MLECFISKDSVYKFLPEGLSSAILAFHCKNGRQFSFLKRKNLHSYVSLKISGLKGTFYRIQSM